MSTPTIPRGWRRLRTGSQVQEGDRELRFSLSAEGYAWETAEIWVEFFPVEAGETIIRRVRKTKGRK